jgi:anti-sigma B factor antagonist
MIHSKTHDPNITVIGPGAERLTAMNAKVFKDEVTDLINGGATQLIVDFKDVSFLDSSGLGALVGVLKKIGHRGELSVSGLSNDVKQMFRICRMDRVFKVYDDVDSAVQSMAESQ